MHITNLRHRIKRCYPITERTIQLPSRQIFMTVVEEPDLLLEKLSREDCNGTLHLPYWIYLWSASIGLANYLDLAGTLVGEQILEIGCGLGLAGIVGCQQGGKVLFTDYERDALSLTRYNVWRNGCTDRATFVQMDWNAPCVKGKFSLILASDVIYEEKNWRPVLSLIQRRLTTNGQVIFSEPSRTNAAGFLALLEPHGFTYKRHTGIFQKGQIWGWR